MKLRINLVMITKFVIIVVLFCVVSSGFAYGTSVKPQDISPWGCPANYDSTVPQPETGFGVNGDYLYIHVIDMEKNNFEIWCIAGAISR